MASSGYGPFDEYHNEFRGLIRTIEERLQEQQNGNDNVDDLLKQCEDALLQMKIEARGASGSSLKQELRDIHQACQMQLGSYQSLNSQREELFSRRTPSLSSATATGGGGVAGKTYGNRMTSTQRMAENQNIQLTNALKSIRETEELASEIGQELIRNRESIQRSQGNVSKLSGMMQQANGHLQAMTKKWPFR